MNACFVFVLAHPWDDGCNLDKIYQKRKSIYEHYKCSAVDIISGVAWIGEVITINFVLVPVVKKINRDSRGKFIRQIFPRIFRLASVLSLTAIISGASMSYLITVWKNLGEMIFTRWGLGIAIGGGLGLILTLFLLFCGEPFRTHCCYCWGWKRSWCWNVYQSTGYCPEGWFKYIDLDCFIDDDRGQGFVMFWWAKSKPKDFALGFGRMYIST